MRFLGIALLAALSGATVHANPTPGPSTTVATTPTSNPNVIIDPVYEEQCASDKFEQVWANLTATAGSSLPWPSIDEVGILLETENMNISVHRRSDILPAGRVKAVHGVGAVAKTAIFWREDVVRSLGYTGLFRDDQYNVIVRGSSGSQTDQTQQPTQTSGGMVGAMAFKVFRDGVPSGNVFAMHTLQQWDSFNIFKYMLQNHISLQNLTDDKLLVATSFTATGTRFMNMLGLSDFAMYTADGVKEHRPVFPFQLQFVPNPVLQALYPDNTTVHFVDQMRSVRVGTILYTIQAIHNPYEAPVIIGSVQLTSNFFASLSGDGVMFYKHQLKEEDFAFRPEWLTKCRDLYNCSVCPVDQACGTPTEFYSERNVRNPGAPTSSVPVYIIPGILDALP